MASCQKCGVSDDLKKCARCKLVSYCSRTCQTADWKQHKKICQFQAQVQVDEKRTDALSMLREMPELPLVSSFPMVTKAYNTPEVRMAVLSLLKAKDLLVAQGVCRLWYRTIAFEKDLQQRLFFASGPGKLVMAAYEGTCPASLS